MAYADFKRIFYLADIDFALGLKLLKQLQAAFRALGKANFNFAQKGFFEFFQIAHDFVFIENSFLATASQHFDNCLEVFQTLVTLEQH